MKVEEYFDSLEAYLIDDNRLVTYKWLSKSLGIHVNIAKQVLDSYLQKHEDKKLLITYAVTGIPNDNLSTQQIAIVKESKLESCKCSFKTIVSQHVYSVQKGQEVDGAQLYTVDYDLVKEDLYACNSLSSITYKNSELRSVDATAALKTQARFDTVEVSLKGTPTQPRKAAASTSKEADKVASTNKEGDKVTEKKENNDKEEHNEGKTGVAAMFFNIASKKQEQGKNQIQNKSSKTTKPGASKTQHKSGCGIESFFNRASQSSSKNTSPGVTSSATNSQDSQEKELPSRPNDKKHDEKKEVQKISDTKTDNEFTTNDDVKTKPKVPSSNKSNPSKKRQSGKLDKQPVAKKQRKRIVQISSSESESDNSTMDVEEEIPQNPIPVWEPEKENKSDKNEVPKKTYQKKTKAVDEDECLVIPEDPMSKKATVNEDGKKSKKRVIKFESKMYHDDDGYIVTKREQVTYEVSGESDVESEDPLVGFTNNKTTKKDSKPTEEQIQAKQKNSKRSKTPPKNKQSTLINFFKKK